MLRVFAAIVCSSFLWLAGSLALAQDVGAAQEGICCGATCCLIDGTCLSDGDVNPANSCEVCDPATSQAAWTTLDGCGQPDSGSQPEMDAGSTPPPPSGGGCSVAQSGEGAPLALTGLLAAVFLFRRRR